MASNLSPSSKNFFYLGGKIDPISEVRNAGILTSGKVFWVKDPSDADYLAFKDAVGAEYCYDTIQAAINKCTSDQNDYVMVCPKKDGSAWTLTSGINLNQDKVHLISVGYNPNVAGTAGYSNTLQGFGTSDTSTPDNFLNITGHGCEVAGFRFLGTNGTALLTHLGSAGTVGFITVQSNGNYIHDCALERRGAFWYFGTPAGMVMAGSTKSSQRFDNVFFNCGTQTASNLSAVVLPQSGLDWEFRDCTFEKLGIATTDYPVTANGGTADGIHSYFENCRFINHAGTAPAQAVGGSMPVGAINLMKDCMAWGITAFGGAGVVFTPSQGGGTINNLLQNPGIAIPGTALIVTKT